MANDIIRNINYHDSSDVDHWYYIYDQRLRDQIGSTYNPNTEYWMRDVVFYPDTGYFYKCLKDLPGSSNTPASAPSEYWVVFDPTYNIVDNIDYRGAFLEHVQNVLGIAALADKYDPTYYYQTGDLVLHNGKLYRCTINMSSLDEYWNDQNQWQLVTTNLQDYVAYSYSQSSIISEQERDRARENLGLKKWLSSDYADSYYSADKNDYKQNDIVFYEYQFWIRKEDQNPAQEENSFDYTKWAYCPDSLINVSYKKFQNLSDTEKRRAQGNIGVASAASPYDPNKGYHIGEEVTYNGELYRRVKETIIGAVYSINGEEVSYYFRNAIPFLNYPQDQPVPGWIYTDSDIQPINLNENCTLIRYIYLSDKDDPRIGSNDFTYASQWEYIQPNATSVSYGKYQELNLDFQNMARRNINAYPLGDAVTPEMFGAVGDGIHDDGEALAIACSLAGPYIDDTSNIPKTRPLVLAPGKIYLSSRQLFIGRRIHIYGNGATIKYFIPLNKRFIPYNSNTYYDASNTYAEGDIVFYKDKFWQRNNLPIDFTTDVYPRYLVDTTWTDIDTSTNQEVIKEYYDYEGLFNYKAWDEISADGEDIKIFDGNTDYMAAVTQNIIPTVAARDTAVEFSRSAESLDSFDSEQNYVADNLYFYNNAFYYRKRTLPAFNETDWENYGLEYCTTGFYAPYWVSAGVEVLCISSEGVQFPGDPSSCVVNNLTLNANRCASFGFHMFAAQGARIDNIFTYNFNYCGMRVAGNFEVFCRNILAVGPHNATTKTYGLIVTGSDSRFENIVTINVYTGVWNTGFQNFYTHVHSWNTSWNIVKNSAAIETQSDLHVSDSYFDCCGTCVKVRPIENYAEKFLGIKWPISVQNCTILDNLDMSASEDDASGYMPRVEDFVPIVFDISNPAMAEQIRAYNLSYSHITNKPNRSMQPIVGSYQLFNMDVSQYTQEFDWLGNNDRTVYFMDNFPYTYKNSKNLELVDLSNYWELGDIGNEIDDSLEDSSGEYIEKLQWKRFTRAVYLDANHYIVPFNGTTYTIHAYSYDSSSDIYTYEGSWDGTKLTKKRWYTGLTKDTSSGVMPLFKHNGVWLSEPVLLSKIGSYYFKLTYKIEANSQVKCYRYIPVIDSLIPNDTELSTTLTSADFDNYDLINLYVNGAKSIVTLGSTYSDVNYYSYFIPIPPNFYSTITISGGGDGHAFLKQIPSGGINYSDTSSFDYLSNDTGDTSKSVWKLVNGEWAKAQRVTPGTYKIPSDTIALLILKEAINKNQTVTNFIPNSITLTYKDAEIAQQVNIDNNESAGSDSIFESQSITLNSDLIQPYCFNGDLSATANDPETECTCYKITCKPKWKYLEITANNIDPSMIIFCNDDLPATFNTGDSLSEYLMPSSNLNVISTEVTNIIPIPENTKYILINKQWNGSGENDHNNYEPTAVIAHGSLSGRLRFLELNTLLSQNVSLNG